MKIFELKLHLIAPLVMVCCLAGVGSQVAQAQGTPTSGAMLTISGTAGALVSITIYDSQIHSGTVQPVPVGVGASNCNANDALYPTDAYVLQGGSWTGCDPGDAFEVTDDTNNNASGVAHQAAGKADISGFHIETHYVCSGSCSGFPAVDFSPYCNTSGTICTGSSGPDSGFLTVTNNTGSPFTGTITLKGTSPIAGGSFCPASMVAGGPGVASDSWTSGLATGASVRLALGSPTQVSITAASNIGSGYITYTYASLSGRPLAIGKTIVITGMSVDGNNGTFTISGPPSATTFTVQNPTGSNASNQTGTGIVAKSADSSDCGGFNQSQTQTLTAGSPSAFYIGNDIYTMTPFNSALGDELTLLPVPVPAGPLINSGTAFGSETLSVIPTSPFSATNYPTQASVPYKDFSANGNPVGVEFQLTCTPGSEPSDCSTFLNTVQVDFTVDPNSFPDGIGGAQFLGEHDNSPADYNGQCPTTGFNVDIFFSYTATTPDPIRGKTLGNSCFVVTFDPTAPVASAANPDNQKVFVGFQSPVVDDPPNKPTVNKINAGKSVPLIWQTFDPISGKAVTNLTLCTDETFANCPMTNPWVFVGTIGVSCSSGVAPPFSLVTPAGNSGLQNFLNGTYEFALKTSKTETGCFTPVLEFSFGSVSYNVATFEFK